MMATPVLGSVMTRAVKPGRRMLLRMMASMGESDTITRHPDVLDSLVAGAKDPVAVAANRSELQAIVSPFGYRPTMRSGPRTFADCRYRPS